MSLSLSTHSFTLLLLSFSPFPSPSRAAPPRVPPRPWLVLRALPARARAVNRRVSSSPPRPSVFQLMRCKQVSVRVCSGGVVVRCLCCRLTHSSLTHFAHSKGDDIEERTAPLQPRKWRFLRVHCIAFVLFAGGEVRYCNCNCIRNVPFPR